ncbi:MAG: SEL1-like repeat protein [Nitrospinae bacterium]|nr:SEL1-like repeat protein [Nitrospinota bacterium]
MTIPWLRLSARVAHFLGVTLPEETDFEVGVEAWGRGDYDTALQEFQLLAVQGHAQAQVNLGIMYSQGRGVPKDSVQAYRWYTLAAGQGDDLAERLKYHLEKSMTLDQLAEAQITWTQLWRADHLVAPSSVSGSLLFPA